MTKITAICENHDRKVHFPRHGFFRSATLASIAILCVVLIQESYNITGSYSIRIARVGTCFSSTCSSLERSNDQNDKLIPPLDSFKPALQGQNLSLATTSKGEQKPGPANTTAPSTASSPYAYAFLLAGCDPESPSYLGFLFNVLVSTQILKEQGSDADFIILVRMAAHSTATVLPAREVSWLNNQGIKIQYVRKPKTENYMESQMIKFRILEMVEYRRVLFLDADVMPLCNLDYLFKLSDGRNAVIKENLVVAWTGEPANGGFFMLEPGKERFEELRQIVKRQRAMSRHLPYPHFDEIQGWGHIIGPNDIWQAFGNRKTGKKWDFYAAYVDQGLLYHYVKYSRKSVTIVSGEASNSVQNWHRGPNNTVELESVIPAPFKNYTCRKTGRRREEAYGAHPAYGNNLNHLHPYSDYVHFYYHFKPWLKKQLPAEVTSKEQAGNSIVYWFFVLRFLNRKLEMGVDFENWTNYSSIFTEAPLGNTRVAPLSQIQNEGPSGMQLEISESILLS